ncbi:hypothetical protein P4S73_28820 [Paraglaciecola sp. Hal342]|uniref:Uncharacterized protein n=1 Tax=Paraglaciecola chathamensis S18K6 TaxID=1127672 RepID=A0AAV3UTH3_9ALTE|nr:hypothetical protein GCHA_0495 [Paraglaciecola chathamensis S18K6]
MDMFCLLGAEVVDVGVCAQVKKVKNTPVSNSSICVLFMTLPKSP